MRDSGFTLSLEKKVFVVFFTRYGRNQIKINDFVIHPSKQVQILGVTFQYQLRWTSHIRHITDKARKKIGLLRVLANQPQANTGTNLRHLAQVLVRPVLTHIWTRNLSHTSKSPLVRIQSIDALALK